MSYKIVPFQPGAIPDYIRGEGQSALTKSLLKQAYNVKRISIKGKRFRLIIGGEEVAKNKDGYLDVIIVNGSPTYNRTYYEGKYDPRADEQNAPRCWSNDSKVPAPDVSEPMHDNCRDCPMNIKGSGDNDTRACKTKQRIAVALAVDPESGVYMLEIPPASIFGKGQDNLLPWEAYVRFVSSQQMSVDRLVTRITMDEDSETPRLLFTPVGYPPRELLSLLDELGQSEDAKMAINMQVYQADAAKALPAPKKAAALPPPVEEEEEEEAPPPPPKKTKPRVVMEEDEEEEAAPPVVRTAAKAKSIAQPAGKPDLTSILSKFGKPSAATVDDEDEE